MKRLTYIVISLCLAVNAAGRSPARVRVPTTKQVLTEQQIARKALASLVYIEGTASKQSDGMAYGTGFFIEGGFITTCYHVVSHADGLFVSPVARGHSHRARLLEYGHVSDLAILLPEDGYRLPALA